MKKIKKLYTVICAAVMSFSAITAMSAGVSADWVKFKDGSYGYIDSKTDKQLTGWQTIDGGRYYFDKNGKALTGWKKISGKTYYFNAAKKGKAVTSWVKMGDKKYYFEPDGAMQTGWADIKGKTYYFGADGVMRTGKRKIGGTVYDFGTDGMLVSPARASSAYDVMHGLKMGMSADEVIRTLDLTPDQYEFYNYRHDEMYIYLGDDVITLGLPNDSLVSYNIIITGYSDEKLRSCKNFFADGEWEQTESETDDGYGLYRFSKDNNSCEGLIIYYEDEVIDFYTSDYSQ